MKELLLKLKGYTLIDVFRGEWTHIFYNTSGEEISFIDYSIYKIFYNRKKDKYEITLSGFNPMEHVMYEELMNILNFINIKPEIENFEFTNSSQDYFSQKTQLVMLMNNIDMDYSQNVSDPNTVVVLRMKLENIETHLPQIKKEDERLIKIMQEFKAKNLVKKNLEIYDDFGNVIVTSEGCYFTAYNSQISSKDENEDESEDEE